MKETGSELEHQGTLGQPGTGWLAHKVFCPQKWSLDGKLQNHWSGSFRVSLGAVAILRPPQWALGAGGGATEAEGVAPATQHSATLPRALLKTFFSQGCWGTCLDGTGWAWEWLTQECQVSLSLSGLSFFFFFGIFSFSGVPGKKCGTIILSAEELSNCRVSSRITSPWREPRVDKAPHDLADMAPWSWS